jgi:thiol-disulfide isomerase/thioredoxin
MKTWLLLLFCSIIRLPCGVTPFVASSSGAAGQRHGGSRSITQRRFVAPTSHEDVWVPPSQQLLETRSNIFKIQNPEDLLSFIAEDDRICVIKVFATWCQTCKKIDLRYRKLASKFSDKYADARDVPAIKQRGKARFAELQYDNPQTQDLCDSVLRTTSFPYILIYKGHEGKIREFHCTPAKFQMLVDAVEELAEDDDRVCGVTVDDSLQKQVIDLGLADRR